jgi:hypothetical protein
MNISVCSNLVDNTGHVRLAFIPNRVEFYYRGPVTLLGR